MRAMILAAGRGERLRPITDTCPKPLVKVGGKPLIVYHLENLKKSGITDIVINLHYLGEKIESYLGNGSSFEVNIAYSKEPKVLEVGGGIHHALPLLGNAPFMIVNGDIWTDYDFGKLPQTLNGLAHLVLVNNPDHHPQGDFGLSEEDGRLVSNSTSFSYTYSGMSILSPALFKAASKDETFRLAPLLHQAMRDKQLYGQVYAGKWTDVGTLERLQALEKTIIATRKE